MRKYGMFSDVGDAMVAGVVMTAVTYGLSFEQVQDVLYDISTLDGFEEAADTAVREAVYIALENLSAVEYDGQPDEAQEWHDFDPDC